MIVRHALLGSWESIGEGKAACIAGVGSVMHASLHGRATAAWKDGCVSMENKSCSARAVSRAQLVVLVDVGRFCLHKSDTLVNLSQLWRQPELAQGGFTRGCCVERGIGYARQCNKC